METSHAKFEHLFEAHQRQVRAFCARRVSAEVVDDVVAETFAVAWDKQAEVPVGSAELPWLYAVAYRVIQHEWRGTGRRRRLHARATTFRDQRVTEPSERVVADEERRLVLDAAARLTEHDQEILRLTLWEELSAASAGVVLGISPDAAKQRASRARRRLASEFNRLSGPERATQDTQIRTQS